MRPTSRGWSHFYCIGKICEEQSKCRKALKNTHLGEDDLQPKWVILFMLRSDAARTTRTGQS